MLQCHSRVISVLINAKFMEELLWQVGVKAKKNKEGIVTWDELEMCIKEVTVGTRSEEIVKNAT